jgi:hypothetical protein
MTIADIRARIAASDGSDQAIIFNMALECFFIDDEMRWAEMSMRGGMMIDADAYTDAALLIAENAFPDHAVKSSPRYAELMHSKHRAKNEIGSGETRALAIIDAVCAAKEKHHD